MKQNFLRALVVLGLIVMIIGCGKKYSDVVEVNRDFAKQIQAYIDDVAKVDSADKAAAAINKLADGMEKLVPKMKAMKKKYPELKKAENLPEELKKTEQEMEAVGREFGSSFMKLMPYMSDKKVQEAQARLSKIMSSLGQE